MTRTSAVDAAGALDGALLRLAVTGPDWAAQLPAVPRGQIVTVTMSSPTVADRHGDALQRRGYRVAGLSPRPSDAAVAELLVPQALIESQPRYWRALVDRAEQAFSLAHGPVLARLAAELQVHAAALRAPGRDRG